MSDQVAEFVSQLERAVRERERGSDTPSDVEAAILACARLIAAVECLVDEGVSLTSLAIDDLRAFEEELAEIRPRPLDALIEQAAALLRVVDDGIIAGDGGALRAALERAESAAVSAPTQVSTVPDLLGLIRARCSDCGVRVVGRRHPASSWHAVGEMLADHERDRHGGQADEGLEAAVLTASRRLESGAALAEVGRYSLTTALHAEGDSGDSPPNSMSAARDPSVPVRPPSPKTARPGKAHHDRAAQWLALPVGTRFARRSDPSIVGEIVADHGFRVNDVVYPFNRHGSPLSAAGRAISGTSENGWVTWRMLPPSGD